MDNPLSHGRPFESAGFWRSSAFAPDIESGGSIFDLPEFTDLDLSSLRLKSTEVPAGLEFGLHIPELAEGTTLDLSLRDVAASSEQLSGTDVGSQSGTSQHQDQPDLWTTPLESNPPLTLHTWEAFEGKEAQCAERTAYLSEAGPMALSAMLSTREGSRVIDGTLPQDVSLRAFWSLVLGRSSIFFQWHATKRCFEPILSDIPVLGLSLECSTSMTQYFIDHGSDFRRLYEYASSTSQRKTICPATTALKRCIESVLDNLEVLLSTRLPSTRTILQLQSVLRRSRELLDLLLTLSQAVKHMTTDEQTISILSDEVRAMVESGNTFVPLMDMILARASQPWVDTLSLDLGFASASPGLEVDDDVVTGGPNVDLNASFQDAMHDRGEPLGFLSQEDTQLIYETKASLRMLRLHFPDCTPRTTGPSFDSIEPDLTFSGAQFMAPEYGDTCAPLASATSDIWAVDEMQLGLQFQLASAPAGHGLDILCDNDIRDALAQALNEENSVASPCLTFGVRSWPSLNPLESLRLSVNEQARLVSKTLLRSLFHRSQLRKHLEIQRSFHLFGSGDFVTRLSTALFSPHTQSAERTRGITPTSQTVGLRLAAREGQHWPPASSELQLTLKDVLTDVYHRHPGNMSDAPGTHHVPGGLSFTIRELSDAEIDRVMDPTSIHALDFLKIQYTAPAPLDAVITPAILQKYDNIFRFLLKLIRLQDVTMRLRSLGRDSSRSSRVALSARHFVTTLLSHFMDIGIEVPWKAFEDGVSELEASTFSASDRYQRSTRAGLYHLRKMHEECLDTIRDRLFLKQKHTVIRSGIEDVLQAIMQAALCPQTDEVASGEGLRFEAAAARLVRLLQQHVDKPPKTRGNATVLGQDDDTMRLLLSRLDWNEFYSGNR